MNSKLPQINQFEAEYEIQEVINGLHARALSHSVPDQKEFFAKAAELITSLERENADLRIKLAQAIDAARTKEEGR